MDIFELRNKLISEYQSYVQSFICIKDPRIKNYVDSNIQDGMLWPEPLIQLNPSFQPGDTINNLVEQDILHPDCSRIFRIKNDSHDYDGKPLTLHKHQSDAIKVAQKGRNYVLTTGTGSGKSLAYIIPITNYILYSGSGNGIKAIVVYPMNALANSQYGELTKFLSNGFPDGKGPVTFAKYTGQESDQERNTIITNPPDILLTNYVMLELILTRPAEKALVRAAKGLKFLVFDELHTYRGRQGADVGMLARRVSNQLNSRDLQYIGTSATLAGTGSFHEQCEQVAEVASDIFGSPVASEDIIGETLRRATPEMNFEDPDKVLLLHNQVLQYPDQMPDNYSTFIQDPISSWIESIFGVTTEQGTGRLIRSIPRSIEEAARELSQLCKTPEEDCVSAIKRYLLSGYDYKDPATHFPVFAFRLHQFISKGDTVYASLDDESTRHLTTQVQQYVPGDRTKLLYPLVFCRECGQEYYRVRTNSNSVPGERIFEPSGPDDQLDEDMQFGYLYLNTNDSYPNEEDLLNILPDDWIDDSQVFPKVKQSHRKYLPQQVKLNTSGKEDKDGIPCLFIPGRFQFCMNCGVSYHDRQKNDFAKLATLTSEGRSSATTILSLSAIKYLRHDPKLRDTARKLLSFTDNRQDASLQAGHFNDFIEIGILRSAIYQAALDAGPNGMRHEQLTNCVFDALKLPLDYYAANSSVRFEALENTKHALREVLGYRIYRDLKRGWRITSPNLEQCGLLKIHYSSLEDVCKADDLWEHAHPALATATPEIRKTVAETLLDLMRRELAIKVNYLEKSYQESIQQHSDQSLKEPWSLDDDELRSMEESTILFPQPRPARPDKMCVFLSPRGGFGNYLGRNSTFPNYSSSLDLEGKSLIIQQLLDALRIGGLVEIVKPQNPKEDVAVNGYQLKASSLIWTAADGTIPYHDPIRIPRGSNLGGQTNSFFVDFYKNSASQNIGIEAREHTAQVSYEEREDREKRFREGKLPVLFCSPTMELGVDISELNVVNMRNIPPTPANYAQRSGRAGRSGQPALVFSYCTTGSPHDQYFFKRPYNMVSGAVVTPRLDLANEDLIRAHMHAVWLTETDLDLKKSLKDILDLSNETGHLPLLDSVKASISNTGAKDRARKRCQQILASIKSDLDSSDWYNETWLDEVLDKIHLAFDQACDRWRTLYLSALKQARAQDQIIRDPTRPQKDKNEAYRLRQEAESQQTLLTDVGNVVQSDFYSYRYFASEGFLPGYSFPRLPLSAYIPAKSKYKQDEYLSRSRFLAISEFGPRAIIYHDGSRYRINKVILPVVDSPNETDRIGTSNVKLCPICGYMHPISDESNPDCCEHCGQILDEPLRSLFRLQNVSTKRIDRINSDEEDRMRLGYDIITGARFATKDKTLQCRSAILLHDDEKLAEMHYGDRATIWRINLGWRNRKNPNQYGFTLDLERGYWAKAPKDDDREDLLSPRTERVIPYVEDRRNCLLLEFNQIPNIETFASLEAALKSAIQVEYQLEDNELAVESLPSKDDRRLMLFYEAAEGGAGVLRRLVYDPQAFSRVARRALEICHYNPDSGEDLRKAPRANENCEAACYDCLMNYANQTDHKLLDRKLIRDILLQYKDARVEASPVEKTRSEHKQELMRLCQSSLEMEWLKFIDSLQCVLPSGAQVYIESLDTRPDFIYDAEQAVIYIDGPYHEFPERAERDRIQTEALEDAGYQVIRFREKDDWKNVLTLFPYIFRGKQ